MKVIRQIDVSYCVRFNFHVLFYQEKPGELVDSRLDRERIEVDTTKRTITTGQASF